MNDIFAKLSATAPDGYATHGVMNQATEPLIG
jgi:hypothetical protein